MQKVDLKLTWWWCCPDCEQHNYAVALLKDQAAWDEYQHGEDIEKWARQVLETPVEDHGICYFKPEKVTCEGCLETFTTEDL